MLLEMKGKFTIRKPKSSRLSYSLVESVPLDTESSKSRNFGEKKRRLNPKWLKDNTWMRYSVSGDSIYCAPCMLFGRKDDKEKSFINPVTDWGNLTNYVNRHLKPESQHHINQAMSEDFLRTITTACSSIKFQLSTIGEDQVQKNKHILRKIMEVLILCGKQNIPIRGHVENRSNFMAILWSLAKDDIVLSEHLSNPNVQFKYTSPDIQNEILQILGTQIQKKIVEDCNRSGYFALLADETTDKSTKEQVSVCVRFIDAVTVEVREEFLTFVHAKDTTGETVSDILIDALTSIGINIDKIRAQGYDGAGNMSGKNKGVQARIREIYPEAVYVHCKSHCLNLAIVHSCKEPCVRTLMGTVQEIAFAFDYSAKRLEAFTDELLQDEQSKENMDKRIKLRTLCETRWTSRSDALYTFLQAYPVVVHALEYLQVKSDDKAGIFLSAIMKWEFIISLIVCEHILGSTVYLSTYLQNVSCDLVEAVRECRVVIGTLQAERNDEQVLDALYDKAILLAEPFDIEPTMPRRANRQQHRANYPADTPKQYWRLALYLPFIDHLIEEMQSRLIDSEGRFLGQYLMPIHLNQLTDDIQARIFQTYAADLPDIETFNSEIKRWQTRWRLANETPRTLRDVLAATVRELYPCIFNVCSVLLTMTATTASVERSFSVLKRVKSYLRATMRQERMSSLAVMHIHREFTFDMEQAMYKFATQKNRRINFGY